MRKLFVWILILVGAAVLVYDFYFQSQEHWIYIIGILIMYVGLYLGLNPRGILRKEQVIDNWNILIENGQGHFENIFQDTESFIQNSEAPSVETEMRSMAPGFFKNLIGRKRNFLEVTDRENAKMVPYQIYVNARDYGHNLDISWYLTYRPTFWQGIVSLIPFVKFIPKKLTDLDLFNQQDLIAFATNAHHCLLKAVEKLMTNLNQDPTKIDRRSRGFLGIS